MFHYLNVYGNNITEINYPQSSIFLKRKRERESERERAVL
jgi:hypothetical protein